MTDEEILNKIKKWEDYIKELKDDIKNNKK